LAAGIVISGVAFREIRYAATPTLSVAAVHDSAAAAGEAVTWSPAGEAGGVESIGPAVERHVLLPLSLKVPVPAGRKVHV
jgi:hypothetical protein